MSFSSLGADLQTLYRLSCGRISGSTHQERLESFYAPQAAEYDSFRERSLCGRQKLMQYLAETNEKVKSWIDIGAGTGRNLEFAPEIVSNCDTVYLVDLSQSLLDLAAKRVAKNGWQNVRCINADATNFEVPSGGVDLITFSYSLTMIPDWFKAIEQAAAKLRPGGRIGVTDFYVSRKYPLPDLKRHNWITRTFWPIWFGLDNVNLSSEHLPFLMSRFTTEKIIEARSKIPYLPFGRVPYYTFIGRGREAVQKPESVI